MSRNCEPSRPGGRHPFWLVAREHRSLHVLALTARGRGPSDVPPHWQTRTGTAPLWLVRSRHTGRRPHLSLRQYVRSIKHTILTASTGTGLEVVHREFLMVVYGV